MNCESLRPELFYSYSRISDRLKFKDTKRNVNDRMNRANHPLILKVLNTVLNTRESGHVLNLDDPKIMALEHNHEGLKRHYIFRNMVPL